MRRIPRATSMISAASRIEPVFRTFHLRRRLERALSSRVAFLALAVATTACIDVTPVSPDANTLVVHAVLDPSVRHQIIVVQTTTGAVAVQRQVTGAVVTIATPDGRTLTAVERRDTAAVGGFGPFPRVTTIYDVDAGEP